jgi:hypothetical protein
LRTSSCMTFLNVFASICLTLESLGNMAACASAGTSASAASSVLGSIAGALERLAQRERK